METQPSASLQAALELFRQGRLPEAEEAAQSALAKAPGDEQAMLLLAVVAAKANRFETAIERLTALSQRYPKNYDAWNWMARAYRALGDFPSAKQSALRAVELQPANFDALNNLGDSLFAGLEFREAAVAYRRASQLAPKSPLLRFNLGRALAGLGRLREAELAFMSCLALAPRYAPCFLELGEMALSLQDTSTALLWADRALKASPHWTAAHLLAARAHLIAGDDERAEAEFAWIHVHEPADNPYLLKGLELQTLGRFEEAREALNHSVSEFPLQGMAYYAIVSSKASEGVALTPAMESALANPATLPWNAARFHYALGRVHESRAEYAAAMDRFDAANRITQQTELLHRPFDLGTFGRLVDGTIDMFGSLMIAGHPEARSISEKPIFIMGQIRSGTTLLEQIVGSHPEVATGGELALWNVNASECLDLPNRRLNSQNLLLLAQEYEALLERIGGTKARVTDKNPENYLSLGLIHLAFPNARILCLERNPVDVCLSVWSTPMSPHPPWANGKAGIVSFYRQYLRLMEHWRAVIPEDRLMFVSYEELVRNREATTRKVIDFCGLPWDDACLYPERKSGAVSTPSVWQARQPVYASSLERWKNYEGRLGEFGEFLS